MTWEEMSLTVDLGGGQTWFIAGAALFLLAGGAHALLSLLDTVRPRWFAPIDDSVRAPMEGTGMRFRRLFPGEESRPSLWSFWLGFNVSHGLGACAFGALCILIAIHDYGLVARIGGLQALTIVVAAGYFATALRYWFNGAQLLTGLATACFVLAAVLPA